MANNEEGFDRAKKEGEPALRRALLQIDCDFPPGIIVGVDSASEMCDKRLHVDLFVHYAKQNSGGKRGLARIDLKDPDRIDTGNVTVSVDEVDFFKIYDEEAFSYFLAFRLNDGISKRYNKFRLFGVLDVLSYIDEKKPRIQSENGKRYYLLSLIDLTESKPFFEVGSTEW